MNSQRCESLALSYWFIVTKIFFSFTQGEKEYKADKALTVHLKIFYFEVNESNLGEKKSKTQTLLTD